MLAAAVAADASVLITSNTRDFRRTDTAPWGVTAMTADEFLVSQLTADTLGAVAASLEAQAALLGQTVPQLLTLLGTSSKRGAASLPRFVAAFETHAQAPPD